MPLDDLPLHRSTEEDSGPSPRRGPTPWVVLGAAVVVAGAALAFWWLSHTQPDTATPAPTAATDAAVASHRPKRQLIDLPSLDGSDDVLRQSIALLSRHPLLARLLATPGLVRSATLAVVQIGDGRTPATPLAVLQPPSRLTIVGTASGPIDPASYHRWDGATAALTSVDPKDAAQVYVNVKQLFDQAYRELGHSPADFDEAIVRAIQTLRETPPPTAPPVLERRTGYYEHEDLTLRALRPVQKQLLLIGPDNRRAIMAWLTQVAGLLDLIVGVRS
jgi:hypothetical protein